MQKKDIQGVYYIQKILLHAKVEQIFFIMIVQMANKDIFNLTYILCVLIKLLIKVVYPPALLWVQESFMLIDITVHWFQA